MPKRSVSLPSCCNGIATTLDDARKSQNAHLGSKPLGRDHAHILVSAVLRGGLRSKAEHLRYVTRPQVGPWSWAFGMSRDRVGEGAVVGMPKTATVEPRNRGSVGRLMRVQLEMQSDLR
jgi:hypothetical protein